MTKTKQTFLCDKEEVNFVARAQNWEQRVAVEMESAKVSFGFNHFFSCHTTVLPVHCCQKLAGLTLF